MSLVRVVAVAAVFGIAVAWWNGAPNEGLVLAVVALTLAGAGFALLGRIAGEGSEQPPAWRYRDRR